MGSTELWRAVRAQANCWAETETVQQFAAQLPRNAGRASKGLPSLLQHLDASGARVSSHPLTLAHAVPIWMPLVRPGTAGPGPDLPIWLEEAQRVEQAHRQTVAWLRSRLPGYPMLRALHLAPKTPVTTLEYTHRLIWTPEERGRGLQFLPAPPDVGDLLGANRGQRPILDQAARSVALGLQATAEWQRFAQVSPPSAETTDTLRAACVQMLPKLRETAVDATAGTRAVTRAEYREHVLAEAQDALTGSARDFSDAFDKVNRLIDTTCSEVFSQLACHGDPTTFSTLTELDIHPGAFRRLEFGVAFTDWPALGGLAWLDDPLVADAVRITGITMHLDQAAGPSGRITADVLEGTSSAWKDSN